MNKLIKTSRFDRWLKGLKDLRGKARILVRLETAAAGHFGDTRSVGGGVSEMRVHTGPGYRIYFTRTGETVYILLVGGDKSRQSADIEAAKSLALELQRSEK